MKHIITLLAIFIGIALPAQAQTSQATDSQNQTYSNEFYYVGIAHRDIVFDDPEIDDYYSNELHGGGFAYEKTLNENHKLWFSYQKLLSPIDRYDTGKHWEENNLSIIYETERQFDIGAISSEHYIPLAKNNSVKLYLSPSISHVDYNIRFEYINDPESEIDETTGYDTDANLDVGFSLFLVEALEIKTYFAYERDIAIDDDSEPLESRYDGNHINIEYTAGNSEVYFSTHHDNDDSDYSYKSIGFRAGLSSTVALNLDYTVYSDDSYVIIFGPSVKF